MTPSDQMSTAGASYASPELNTVNNSIKGSANHLNQLINNTYLERNTAQSSFLSILYNKQTEINKGRTLISSSDFEKYHPYTISIV
jgi:hypothetical protein